MKSPWLLVNELTSRKRWRSGQTRTRRRPASGGPVDPAPIGKAIVTEMKSKARLCRRGRGQRPGEEDNGAAGHERPRGHGNQKRVLAGVTGESAPEAPGIRRPDQQGRDGSGPRNGNSRIGRPRGRSGETRRVKREHTGPRRDPAKPGVDQSRSLSQDRRSSPSPGPRAGGKGDRGRKTAF